MTSFTQRVAEAILNDAQSGSAVWDELNGPSAQMIKYGDDIFTITVPQEYNENDEATDVVCVITVAPKIGKHP
jgi:hypothetical protein